MNQTEWDREQAEWHVFDLLASDGISETASETGTVDNMLAAGWTFARIAHANRAHIAPYVEWV